MTPPRSRIHCLVGSMIVAPLLLLAQAAPALAVSVKAKASWHHQHKVPDSAVNDDLAANSTGTVCAFAIAGSVAALYQPGGSAACNTNTSDVGQGFADVKKFGVLPNGNLDPKSSLVMALSSDGVAVPTTADATAAWSATITQHPGNRKTTEAKHTVASNVARAAGFWSSAGRASADSNDPIIWTFSSPDTLEFGFFLGDSADTVSFACDREDGETRFEIRASFDNVTYSGNPLNGELFSLSMGSQGLLLSPADLDIEFTPWSGLGLTPAQIAGIENHIRSQMNVLADGSIGWTGSPVVIFGDDGFLPSVVLDCPSGTVVYRDETRSSVIVPEVPAGVPIGSEVSSPLGLRIAPNPVRTGVRASLYLPRATRLEAEVLDLAGRRVATVHDGWSESGEISLEWNGRSPSGANLTTGTYWLHVKAGSQSEMQRFVWAP